jgi:phosphohistidine phosphatase SixA
MRNAYKEIWLVRHGKNVLDQRFTQFGVWQPTSPLSQEGCEAIERVKNEHLEGETFQIYGHSGYVRAKQTAEILAPCAPWEIVSELAPHLASELDTWIKKYILGLTSDKYPNLDDLAVSNTIFRPDFTHQEGRWILRGILHMLGRLQEGEKALLVSHQPLIGLVRGMLDLNFDPLEQSLEKGGIYRFLFSAHELATVVHYAPP